MWWITQFFAIVLITVAHIFNRWAGLNGMDFSIRWIVNVGMQAVAAPLFIVSYMKSPSFFQPWFLGTALIALMGFVASLIFFGETIAISKIIAAALALAGAVLLIL
jgi:hypothetical protein